MSCPSEPTWLLYVEDACSEPERQPLDAHLIRCRACRETVVALQREGMLLRDVIQERERRLRVAARTRQPEAGVTVGLPLAIAMATAAIAAFGFLMEWGPGGLDHLNPLRLKGAYEMAFDLIFLARDRAPGLVELALSVGAMASVSAILTLCVGAIYRRAYGAITVLLLALLCGPAGPAEALEVQLDTDTSVPEGRVVQESMLLSGDRVHIAGEVEGDVWMAAERCTLAGTVKGSVYALCRDFELTGTIEGSLHGAIEDALLDGKVAGSVYALAETLTLGDDGVIERDLGLIAEAGILDGTVGRDVVFGGDELEIRAAVGRDVDVRWADRLTLRDGARVAGGVSARIPEEDHLIRAPRAEVGGGVEITPWDGMKDHYLSHYGHPRFYAWLALGLVAAFLFGLLLRWLAPRLMERELSTTRQFVRSLGYGFAALVATPIAILVLCLSIVGVPIGVLCLFAFVVMVYSAELIVAAWLGRTLLPPADDGWLAWSRSFFVGLAVLTVATHVPFLGPPVMIVATLIGAGLFVDTLREAAPPPLSA